MMILFGLGLWTPYTNKVYEKQNKSKYAWYWLKVFKIEINKTNCVKFIKFTSLFAIVLINLFILIPLLLHAFA
jgi:hypothetical protein